ncbi:hypothetical protein [Sulfobacillus sp. hq2]|uniref:EamA domain-containing protein n=1 Tax=Sulfobacillus thermotolerans TaxID=338644 RepID=A0ABN5H2J1_9FIRM|nr:hypothetical protein [Sulfobacillus sp. hq2]AUW94931.1 hypothetical protein BXT84_14020 [Sulfobacillus thermotolerans]POB10452.1 hypothetical protein CO251_10975 [Sulfobacillus sp. hq2]
MTLTNWLLIIFYAILSSSALMLMKAGLANPSFHLQVRPQFSIMLSYTAVVGIVLYIASFITWLGIIRNTTIVLAYPLSIGLVQLVLVATYRLLLHQRLSVPIVLGSALILAGIVVLSRAS